MKPQKAETIRKLVSDKIYWPRKQRTIDLKLRRDLKCNLTLLWETQRKNNIQLVRFTPSVLIRTKLLTFVTRFGYPKVAADFSPREESTIPFKRFRVRQNWWRCLSDSLYHYESPKVAIEKAYLILKYRRLLISDPLLPSNSKQLSVD